MPVNSGYVVVMVVEVLKDSPCAELCWKKLSHSSILHIFYARKKIITTHIFVHFFKGCSMHAQLMNLIEMKWINFIVVLVGTFTHWLSFSQYLK